MLRQEVLSAKCGPGPILGREGDKRTMDQCFDCITRQNVSSL